MQGVRSDLSIVGLMKLVEDVVEANSKIDEIELHALISTSGELSRPIIKDDEDVALILLEQRNVPTMYVSIKGCQTNVMSHEEVGQYGNQLNQKEIYKASQIPKHSFHNPQQWKLRCASNQFLHSLEQMQRSGETVECVMPLSNENTTVEDNNVRLEGDTTTPEDSTTFDEGNEDLFTTGEDRFDDTSDDGLEQSQDDSSNNDCLYDSDIPICNNVEGETEPIGGVDVRDVQCDDPIYNNPIADENWICSLDTLLDDSDQERGNAGISRTWVIAGAERVKRSCKVRYEVGCKDKACKFSVRATQLPDKGEYWQVRTFHKPNGVTLRPKDIICEMRVQWGLECLYGKAWQVKEYAEKLVFGSPEESFQLLPSYFYMLEQENPGTVTAVATDKEERFKYCFWSYGACIQGFRDVMLPMVAIDATHLKGRTSVYIQLLLASAMLRTKTRGCGFLAKAHHGLCGYHLKKNFKNKFKCDDVCMLFTLARDYYKVADFNRHMNQIQWIHLGTNANLMRIGPEKWARACSPTRRYQMMTSNIAKCVNSCLKHARQILITVLIEFIRDMFQLKPINRVELEVKDRKMDGLVNLSRKTCTCCEFQTDLLPCSHAIAAISKCNHEAIEFCADYYKTIVLVEGYSGSIRPIGHPSEWDIAGRPRRRKIPSAGEGSQARRCSQCLSYGHNRQNCPSPFAVPSTNLAPSPSQSTPPQLR
ncbi:Uncharacterized protein TCM_043606 [Theobroma cacao]|uniref:SWIM-type domain-containing protein n=1 Tax=Theobroma cacao TaxID=3641 RepID=A0A061FNV1_THECC|nr:Uncharacterized protein TCM_043606 [Theobroma cacao]